MRDAARELCAGVPGTALRHSATATIWSCADGARHALAPVEADALELCAAFDTRAEHVRRLVYHLRVPPQQAERVVDDLAARGLIRTLREFLPNAAGAPDALPPPLIVIRSYERPLGLQRLLESLLSDEHRHGATHRYLVVDDSPHAERDAEARALTRAFATASRGKVRYLGHGERDAALAHVLEGFDEAQRAALLPMLSPHHPSAVTGSRTWNWAVLAAAGGALSILDDDVSFPLRVPPNARTEWDLRPALTATTRYFDDDGHRRLAPLPDEPYAWLARSVGQRPGSLLARDGIDAASCRGQAAAALHALAQDAPVAGAIPGIYGAIPFDSSAYLTATDPQSNADLWREPFRVERFDADRLWNGVHAPRLVPEAVYTPLLLDARALLPFAGTWGRVDDQYFLMLLRAIASPIQFALVPALLGHEDPAPRHRRERARQPLLLDRNAWLASVFGDAAAGLAGADRAARLALLGAHCAALASLADAELERRILAWRGFMMLQLVGHQNYALQQHPDAPEPGREQVRAIVAANEGAMATERIGADELTRYRNGLRQVADVAPLWPSIWRRCASEPLWERLPVP